VELAPNLKTELVVPQPAKKMAAQQFRAGVSCLQKGDAAARHHASMKKCSRHGVAHTFSSAR